MKVVTYQGTVENGCVRLPAGVLLPEKATVYVIVPGVESQPVAHIRSPRLADPAQAVQFQMEVTEDRNAGL
jgi:hypothetical protein